MIRRIFKQLENESPKVGEEELQEFFTEIESKKKEIADKKAKFKEEYSNGARLSKHRFTI